MSWFFMLISIYIEVFLPWCNFSCLYIYWLIISTTSSLPKDGENGDGVPTGTEETKPPPTFEEMWFDDPIEVYAKSIIFYSH